MSMGVFYTYAFLHRLIYTAWISNAYSTLRVFLGPQTADEQSRNPRFYDTSTKIN